MLLSVLSIRRDTVGSPLWFTVARGDHRGAMSTRTVLNRCVTEYSSVFSLH